MSGAPALSVVVATRNRAGHLARLLDRLETQEGAPTFEVIVADNGSSDETGRIAKRSTRTYPLYYVRVDQPGKGRALNAALRVAAGDLVVFTDDDVDPDPRWLAEVHAASARYPDASVFGGRIAVDEESVPNWVRRSRALMGLLTSAHDGLDADPVYGYGRYPFGPNMAVRRARLGSAPSPYPENLGPGTSLPVGDEAAFLARVSPPDARDRVYAPAALVHHEVEQGNLTLAAALRRSFAQGRVQARVGIAAVPPAADGVPPSYLRLLLLRIRASTSIRELLCTVARHAGMVMERASGGAR